MAVGDKWEISLAVPLINPHFTEWQAGTTNGPTGWWLDGLTSDIRSEGRAAHGAAYFKHSAAVQWLRQFSGPGSIAIDDVTFRHDVWYKASHTTLFLIEWLNGNRNAVAVTSGSIMPAQADWSQEVNLKVLSAGDGCSEIAIRVQSSNVAGSFELSEVAVRYTPADWSTSGKETLSSTPVVDGLSYAPMPNGKLRLAATFESLLDADCQILRRYQLANEGALDGIPRPVAIRPFLEDATDGPYAEIITGNFTEFSFNQTRLGKSHVGSFVLEEF